MKVCKYCGKEFKSTPMYCTRCGAVKDFLIRKKEVGASDEDDALAFFGEDKSKSYRNESLENLKTSKNTSRKTFDLDDLAGLFSEEQKQEPTEHYYEKYLDDPSGSFLNKRKITEETDPYYTSIKNSIGESPAGKGSLEYADDPYYRELENLLGEEIKSADETTFNGIFKKDDTIENTFLKMNMPKEGKKQRGQGGKGSRRKDELPLNEDGGKSNKKLIKIAVGLGAVLIVLVVALFMMINGIVSSDNKGVELPSKEMALSFFTDIKAQDKEAFMAAPARINFDKYTGSQEEKAAILEEVYTLIQGDDYTVKDVSMVRKGANRILAEYSIEGNERVKKLFASLLLVKNGTEFYDLDFNDFVIQYQKLPK